MASKKLKNYLKTHRRRIHFSQEEVARLLGCQDGTKVCRYERKKREPPLRTLLAYEIIFGVPIRELFAGIYEDVKMMTAKEAKALIRQLQQTSPGCLVEIEKINRLKKLEGGHEPSSAINHEKKEQ